jgi:hypothetical protein
VSYTIRVIRDADGLKVETPHPSALAHVPLGVFEINGHEPAEGTSPIRALGVRFSDPEGNTVMSTHAQGTKG